MDNFIACHRIEFASIKSQKKSMSLTLLFCEACITIMHDNDNAVLIQCTINVHTYYPCMYKKYFQSFGTRSMVLQNLQFFCGG